MHATMNQYTERLNAASTVPPCVVFRVHPWVAAGEAPKMHLIQAVESILELSEVFGNS